MINENGALAKHSAPSKYEIQLVLYNRYDLPIVEFKMAGRQGATREHVLCDL